MNARMRTAVLGMALPLGLVAALACSKSSADTAATTTTTTTTGSASAVGAAKKTVPIEANEKGFTPTSVSLKKGEPATLVFTRTTDETCAKEVVFPDLHVTKELPLKQPVAFDVPVGDARTLTFQCGMGMFKGKIVVD